MAGERILVADDDPEIVRLCTSLLSRQGFSTRGASSGREAWACLEEEPFDLLVADIKMPDMDGLALLRRGREINPDLTTMVITGYATLSSAIEALHAGARSFVLKPFSIEEFTLAVHRVLEERQKEQERLRLRAQLPLLEIAQALMAEGDLAILARQLLEAIARDVGADQASLLLLDRGKNELYVAGAIGLPDEVRSTRIPLEEAGLGQPPLEATVQVVDEVARLPSTWRSLVAQPGVAVAVLVSLRSGNKTVGVLHLGRLAGTPPYTPSELHLLSLTAHQIATALENAQLYAIVSRGKREWEATFDSIADGISIHDDGYRIRRANRSLAQLLGTTPDKLIGRHCYEMIHGLDAPPEFCPLREARRRGKTIQAEWENPRLGRTFLISVYPLHNEEPPGWVHVMRDITERRQAEEEFRRRSEELRALNALAATIGQSFELGHICNAALEKVLEVTEGEGGWIHLWDADEEEATLSLAAHRGLPPETIDGLRVVKPGQGLSGQVAQSGEPIVLESTSEDCFPCTGPSAPRTLGSCVGVPIQAKDTVLGALVVFGRSPREPSPQQVQLLSLIGRQIGVAIENARLARQAAEVEILRELDRLRSELIANVSHELRTPLGLIRVFCTTLLREDAQFDLEIQHEFLRNIEEETINLERIVDNLLDMSRMEQERLRLDKRPIDLGQLVRDVVATMAVQPTGHHLAHETPAEPLLVSVDAKRIEQVLRNLLTNAIKYSPQGGTITVRATRQGGTILVQVSDQGIGIPPGELEHIFERFYRVENETTRRVGGVGLGLSVCRGIVEAHGGRIWAESTLGAGSTFHFTLPAEKAPSPRQGGSA